MPGSPRVRRQSAYLVRVVVLAGAAAGAMPSALHAQAGRDSRWGVTFSSTPKWTLMENLRSELFDGDGTIEGSEFTLGFVRGSTLGGDWGVTWVRKPFKDGSGEVERGEFCLPVQGGTRCFMETTTSVTEGVYLNGVEVHRFFPFATIRERVQIGLNVGGGIAQVKGTIVETREGFDINFVPPNQVVAVPVREVERLEAEEELLKYFPLLKVQAEGAVILARGLKLKVGGGLNFPAFAMRVGVVYLF